MSERNMYGCTECTECYSVYRYPVKEDGKYVIRCDDCGFVVDAEREGDYGWSVAYQDILDTVAKYKAKNERLTAEVRSAGEEYEKALRDMVEARMMIRSLIEPLEDGFSDCPWCGIQVGEFHKDSCQLRKARSLLSVEAVNHWKSAIPLKPGYYWWRQGERIEPSQVSRTPGSETMYVHFIGEITGLPQEAWQPDWQWMPMFVPTTASGNKEGDYNWNPIRRCPHDDKTCKHECDDGECWRELNGS